MPGGIPTEAFDPGILHTERMQWAPYNNDCPVRGGFRRDVSHALKGGFCPATSVYSRSDRELFGREGYVYAIVVAATDRRCIFPLRPASCGDVSDAGRPKLFSVPA